MANNVFPFPWVVCGVQYSKYSTYEEMSKHYKRVDLFKCKKYSTSKSFGKNEL